jgi:lantibiotic modifying enzyme
MTVADHAANIVESIAQHLADPDRVHSSQDRTNSAWHPLSLAAGPPGIILLFAELARHDRRYRAAADDWLAHTAHHLTARPGDGLYHGLPALAFAIRTARADPRHYQQALAVLDEHILRRTCDLIETEHRRRERGIHLVAVKTYDLISGLTGLGTYLLTAGHHTQLRDVLACLTVLTELVRVGEHTVPGWWTLDVPHPHLSDDPRYAAGHLNLGLAHGIAGPLALLALAYSNNIHIERHVDAITAITSTLLDWTIQASSHPRWPPTITRDQYLHPSQPQPPTRPSWCYGTPGIARALQLASHALNQPTWDHTAQRALHTTLTNPHQLNKISDPSLCHGWSGLLHLTHRITLTDQPALLHVDQRLIESLNTGLSTITSTDRMADRGFLEGTCGIALGLHTTICPDVDTITWDRALLAS